MAEKKLFIFILCLKYAAITWVFSDVGRSNFFLFL